MENGKLILDVCCGSRMFWFDKHNPLALFVDKRSEIVTAKDRDKIRTIEIKPEIVIKGEFVNAVFLPKPKGDPFKEAQETPSYIYCKKCNEYYDDYMEPEPCEHICLSNDGELVYRDNGEKVND